MNKIRRLSSSRVRRRGTRVRGLARPHKYSGKQPRYFGQEGIDGEVYAEMLEPIWIEMTKALHTGETVHIIVYNEEEHARVATVLLANEVDLVPIYGDVNDQMAMDIIAGLYPTRKVVGINCLHLALFGGMLHCVTQQQPALDSTASG